MAMSFSEIAVLVAGLLAGHAFFAISVFIHEARKQEREHLEEMLRVERKMQGAKHTRYRHIAPGWKDEPAGRANPQGESEVDRMQTIGTALAVLSAIFAGIYIIL